MSSTLEYLLGEIGVDPPSERERTLKAFPGHKWPEGFWAVSDEKDGYIAYFQHEDDAYGFRLTLRCDGIPDTIAARIASLEAALVRIRRDAIGMTGTFADRVRMHVADVLVKEDEE